jgi:protein disulfide-isomerase
MNWIEAFHRRHSARRDVTGGKIFPALMLAVLVANTRADEQFPRLQAGGETYTNVNVTSVSATDIYFTHAGGMANVKLKKLSPELQQHFSFDRKKASAAELKLAENKTNYYQQLIHQPAVHPPDMSREPANPGARATEALWREDLPGALSQARAEHKLVLLDFTGSDWCQWCIKFEHDVLSTERFEAYAGPRFELVKLDFPHHTPQREELSRANAALARQFHVDGYPTYVLLNPDGRELGRQVGYLTGGPDAFIRELDGFSRR